ncbi:D-sedoheptulose-7-phosphate isomerase [Bauldia sp.]|uniref:D-sedoheptulose-7-phosphate isomerase n=1 Tax=Bauldia sp. TaxID=2575872 RepID=UPI003BAA5BC1
MNPDRAAVTANFRRRLDDHRAVFERLEALIEPTVALSEAAISVLRAGGKLLLCGNGGSAADAQHISTELMVRFETTRPGLPAIALTTDTSAMTAASNDLGYDQIFARQVEALGRPGDMLIGLTTSGTSPSVVEALVVARAMELKTACFTGRDGGAVAARDLADHCLVVPADRTFLIQEAHVFLYHLLCAAIDTAFTPE